MKDWPRSEAEFWRTEAFESFHDWIQGDTFEVPAALIVVIMSAPSSFGAFCREVVHNDTVPTSGKGSERAERDLLPLPYCPEAAEAAVPQLQAHLNGKWLKHRRCWLLIMVLVLNFRYPGPNSQEVIRVWKGPPSKAQSLALGLLGQAADVFLERNTWHLEMKGWKEELRMRKIGYDGEEVGLPHSLTLEQIKPGLPPPGVAASLDALRFATGEVREVLMDPFRLLKPLAEWDEAPRQSKIWSSEEDFERIADYLLELGILEEVSMEEAEEIVIRDDRGRPVRHGMFGVEKPKDEPVIVNGESLPVLRLIFNLIPINAGLRDFEGDVADLPTQGQFNGMALLDREVFTLSSKDRKFFFYIFKLPGIWRWMMIINKVRNRGGVQTRLALASVGMGLKPAVVFCQHFHRNIIRMGKSLGKTVDLSKEVRRRRPLPITAQADHRTAWLIYVDDLKLAEIIDHDETEALVGLVPFFMEEAEVLYDLAGTPGTPHKDEVRKLDTASLGERIDGVRGRREPPEM